MDFDQLYYFVTLSKYKQFTVAADELHLSQSSLSKQIKALEEELDTKLFTRSAKGCVLTEEGEIFREFAEAVNQSHQGIKEKLHEVSKTNSNIVHFGTMPVMWEYKISKVISRFLVKEPNCNFNIIESSNTFDLVKRLKTGEFNLIFVGESLLDPKEFIEIPLINDHLVLIVSEEHSLSSNSIVPISSILNERLIILDKCTGLPDYLFETKGLCFENVMTGYTNSDSVLSLVRDNIGVTLLWKELLNGVDLLGLKAIELQEPLSCYVVLGVPKNRKLTSAEREFIDFIQQSFNISSTIYHDTVLETNKYEKNSY